MADNCSSCLVGAMDRLWFHQIILISEPISLLPPKSTLKPEVPQQQPIFESLVSESSCLSLSPLPDEEEDSSDSSDSSAVSPQDDCGNYKEEEKGRRRRLNLITGRARSHSSSPSSAKKSSKNVRYSGAMRRLSKSMSCRSLGDLELEEVKGFMDLGFIFKKEHLSPRMVSVIPGLQRLGLYTEAAKEDEIDEEDEEKRSQVMRPYLSEAWLIKRPNSPLLNMRVPRVFAAADMKKHLKFWARTVASEVRQESLNLRHRSNDQMQ